MGNVDNVIVLRDEDGKELEFEFLDLIDFEGTLYVVFLPIGDGNVPQEVVILAVEGFDDDDSDTESYVSVDDERTLLRVFEIFKSKFKDEFEFVDE